MDSRITDALDAAAGGIYEVVEQQSEGLVTDGEVRLRVLDLLVGLPEEAWSDVVGLAAHLASAVGRARAATDGD